MMDREPILPFAIGLVIAVAMHLALAPGVRAWLVDRDSDYRLNVLPPTPEQLIELQPKSKPDEPLIGQLAPSTATKVNLITYEDYRQLKARKSEFDQPAVQMTIEPEPVAQQVPLDPTPPEAVNPPTAQPVNVAVSPPAPQVAATQSPQQPQRLQQPADQPQKSEEPGQATQQPALPAPRSPGYPMDNAQQPDVSPVASELDVQTAGTVTVAMDSPKPDPQSQATDNPTATPATPAAPPPSPAAQPQPATTAQRVEQATPTVAPKEDFESEPVTEVGYAEVKPGGVLSVQGIQIKTVRPRYSVVAQRTTLPRDPTFMVVFGPEGKVIHVQMLESTGYDNVDGPIITALYKWTAEGNISPNGLTIKELHILLGVDEDEAAEAEE